MTYQDQIARIRALLEGKIAKEKDIEPTRDSGTVQRSEVLEELPEVPAPKAVAIAEYVLAEYFHVLDRKDTDALGFGMVWFTDEAGWRRRQGG